MSETESGLTGRAFISATPTLIYIVVSDAATFDAINAPAVHYEKVSAKTGAWNGVTIIFQFWHEEDKQVNQKRDESIDVLAIQWGFDSDDVDAIEEDARRRGAIASKVASCRFPT